MACIAMAYIATAYVVMAYIVMAYIATAPTRYRDTQAPIGYKVHVCFCSHEGQKTGHAYEADYTLSLQPQPNTSGYPLSPESLRTSALVAVKPQIVDWNLMLIKRATGSGRQTG